MSARQNRQARQSAQLDLFRRDLRGHAANDDDCFASAASPTRSVFNGVLNHRSEKETKLVRLGLELSDAIARQGPIENCAGHDAG